MQQRSCPCLSQGSSWLHVGTDQPFKSISIGAASQVWGIARDGSAFYRGSVSAQSPAGPTDPKLLFHRVETLLNLPLERMPLLLSCVVSPSTGDCWYHIPSPSKQKLKQVSVGRTSVYTVDENGKASTFTLVVK